MHGQQNIKITVTVNSIYRVTETLYTLTTRIVSGI